MASKRVAGRIGEKHEAKKAKLSSKHENECSNVGMPKESTEEQEEDKRLKTSTSGVGDSLIRTLLQKKIDISSFQLLEGISHPALFSEQFDSLKNQLSHFIYCPMHHWEKGKLDLQLCLSNIQDDRDFLNLQVICNYMQGLICPKSKRRSCRQLALKETNIKTETAQQTFPMMCKVVKTQKGVVINSLDKMMISCYEEGKCCQSIKCCSVVTDMTRVETEDKVMATLSGLNKLLIIGCQGTQLLKMGKGYRRISHVGGSTFVGSCMYSRSLHVADWKLKDGMIDEFEIKDYPSDLAVGPRQHILTTFAYLNCVACYTVKGELLFEVNCVSGLPLNMPSCIFADCRYFYFVESEAQQINRVSALGGVSQVKIAIAANNLAIEKNSMNLWNSFGESFIVETGEHFWPKERYCHKAEKPTIDRYVYINNAIEVKDIVIVSDSRVILAYWDRKIVLIDGDNIDNSLVDSVDLEWVPTSLCRWNQAQILVSFSAAKRIEFIVWEGDTLERICQLETTVGYDQLSNKGSNEVVGLTVKPQAEVHMILTGDDKRVTVIALIMLEHGNVTIATSRFNFLVADIDNCKLVFFSFCGKQLSEKKVKLCPSLVSSNGSYFYVVSASRHLVIDCYNIGGHFEGEVQVISHCLPQLDACNGTLCVVDTAYSRVVLYRHDNWNTCEVELKSDSDSWSIDIRYGKRQEKKIMIGAMCLLPGGHIVIVDWRKFQLLLISRNGDIVKQCCLPSLATDICRWHSNHFIVLLPLKKQLWLFESISFKKQVISLGQPYIRVCKFDKKRAVCYCDQPSRLDLVTLKNPMDVTHIKTDIPDYIKSIAVCPDTEDILTWDSRCLLSYNITNKRCKGRDTLFKQRQSLLGGGCTDETLLYVIDNSLVFSLRIVGDSQVISEYVSGYKLGLIEQIDVLSGYISMTEFLSSTVHLQDLTMTERGQHYNIPYTEKDKKHISVSDVAITDNNLITVCDDSNNNLKILSFKGNLLGRLSLRFSPFAMCQWVPNTLVITFPDDKRLLTVDIQFPLSYKRYPTERPYKHIAALSDGRLVCSWSVGSWEEYNYQSGLDIFDQKESGRCIASIKGEIRDIIVSNQDIIVVTSWRSFFSAYPTVFSFYNCSGERLNKVYPVVSQIYMPYSITSDGKDIYITGLLSFDSPPRVICLSHKGQYKRVFKHRLQRAMPNSEGRTTGKLKAIDCRGPRIVVATGSESLYVQGLTIDREALPVSRFHSDMSPVKIKELDISAEGNTIICDTVNNFIMLLKSDGQVICEKRLSAGGVCFMGGGRRAALVTLPHSSQLFALDIGNKSLDIMERWNTQVPYGRIRRLEQNMCFLCFHINGMVQHKVKVVGDTLEIMREMATTASKPGSDSTGTPKLWATCGKYVASSMVGSDTISVRQLPCRSSQFLIPRKSISLMLHVVLLTGDILVIIGDWNKIITLTTLEGCILHEISTDTEPWDVCQWTDDIFIVTFPASRELVFYNKALSRTKTIPTEKGYDYVCKNKENLLICGSRGEPYFVKGERKYRGGSIDILSATDGSVICSTDVTDSQILDIGVTHSSVVLLKRIEETDEKGYTCTRPVLCWYTGQWLHQYKQTFPIEVKDPRQIAIHGRDVYLLAGETGRRRIYCISPTDTCELYLNREQIDCFTIQSMTISKSRLIITGHLTIKTVGVRIFQMKENPHVEIV